MQSLDSLKFVEAEKLNGELNSSHKLTVAMQFSILKELISQLNIPAEDFENIALDITTEEQEKAARNLGAEMDQINKAFQTEVKTFSEILTTYRNHQELPSNTLGQDTPVIEATLPANTDISNSNATAPIEINENLATSQQIQDIVIPLIALRLKSSGVVDEENETITYRSEEYLVVAQAEDNSQTLKLDKIMFDLKDNEEIILASKDNNSERYNISVNNLSENELERFRALFIETFEKTKPGLNIGIENNQQPSKPDTTYINGEINNEIG